MLTMIQAVYFVIETEVTELLRKIENFYSLTAVPKYELPEFDERRRMGDLDQVTK